MKKKEKPKVTKPNPKERGALTVNNQDIAFGSLDMFFMNNTKIITQIKLMR